MAEALWTIEELIAATGGRLHGQVAGPLTAVTIDSRAVGQGDIFVAIRGEKHDGHDFVASALKAGAGLGLVSRVAPEMLAAGPVLEVADDPLRGLESMGLAARARSQAQIVAVTGSVGARLPVTGGPAGVPVDGGRGIGPTGWRTGAAASRAWTGARAWSKASRCRTRNWSLA